MIGNKKPKGGRMTVEDIASAFKIPDHLTCEIDHDTADVRAANIVEIAALEFLRKSAQRYLDEMAPGKFTVTVTWK